jgi:enterochelin esterase-like enzyme
LSEATVLCWTHDSTALAGNPLGDPATRRVYVYLPPGRSTEDCEGLPLILLLPGFVGRGRGMLSDNLYSPAIDDRMTALIEDGCPPAVLALPDCSTKLGGSQYINSSAVGNYRDYLTLDLVPMLRERLRTGPTGVAGKSSGGYGALRLGMEAADIFSAVACHSGDCYFEYGYLPDIPKAAAAIARAGSVDAFLEEFHSRESKSSEQIITLSILAMSACYSPSPDGGFDLPFDVETGAYRSAVFERWLDHDPYRMVEHYVEALKSKALLFIDAGKRDEFHLQLGARLLRDRLTTLGIDHEYEEFDGGHFGTSYRYETSLPLMVRALGSG